jgi:hypothetical protein
VNIKYRSTLEKKFWQVRGPRKTPNCGPELLPANWDIAACLPALGCCLLMCLCFLLHLPPPNAAPTAPPAGQGC